VKVQNASDAEHKSQIDSQGRKIVLLEKDLATAEGSLRIAQEKYDNDRLRCNEFFCLITLELN
jgi:hypothetical protein